MIRRTWSALDTPNRKDFRDKIMLTNLNQCQFAYLSHQQQVMSEWTENAITEGQYREPLPIAIQLTLTFKDWGNMSLLFVIPAALYAK